MNERTSYRIDADGAMWMMPITDRSEAEQETRRLRAEYPHKQWALFVTHSVTAEIEVDADSPSEDTE
jgi:hypothetical protein